MGSELMTSAAVFGASLALLGYFIRRWMERIEAKVDALTESKGQLISRDEFDRGLSRVHTRLDEHLAVEQDVATRLVRLEAGRPDGRPEGRKGRGDAYEPA